MMKKLILACIALMLALCGGALAEYEIGDVLYVANCNEYITLRAEPWTTSPEYDRMPLYAEVVYLDEAENGFYRVAYNGSTGYALSGYLEGLHAYEGADVEVTQDQRYNINLFLSNFTEQGFMSRGGVFDAYNCTDSQLNEFAIHHIWFNRQDRVEWGEWANGANVRLSVDEVPEITQKYFGRTPYDPAASYFECRDGYYYWTETGGHVPDGFACLTGVEDLGSGRIGVYFDSYGMGWAWENDMCNSTAEQAANAYPSSWVPKGFAVINLGGGSLDDRSSWSLEYWAYMAW